MCKEAEESTNHLRFNCKFAWIVWMKSYSWLGIQIVLPQHCSSHFKQQWREGNISKQLNWWVMWCTCILSIWLARNEVAFKSAEADVDKVVDSIQFRSCKWIRYKVKGFLYSFYEWYMNPVLCLKGTI